MAKKELIPQTLPGFDVYIRKAIIYLMEVEPPGPDERFKRLGITQLEMDKAKGYRDEWWTGNPAAKGAYELHTNEDTKTKSTRKTVTRIMNEFTPFFSNLLRRMSTLTYTVTDKSTLNIPERDTIISARTKINDAPDATVTQKGGGIMRMRVRVNGDGDRSSMHPMADAIEVKYFIGDNPPADPDLMTKQVISTSALFNVDAGSTNKGKNFTAYCRYVNISNPENNGPWSNIVQGMIA